MSNSANTASNVTAGKPAVAGAIWAAPVGTTLPQDTSTSLNSAFKCLGYCSEDGLSNGTELDTTDVKAWGGDTVLTIQTSKKDTFKFTLIEVLNEDVLKFVYGAANVSGSLESGLTIDVNNADVEEKAIVIDMVLRNGVAKRIVIPDCKISDLGDITYADGDAVGYETTVTCMPDSDGNMHYEYLKKGTVSG